MYVRKDRFPRTRTRHGMPTSENEWIEDRRGGGQYDAKYNRKYAQSGIPEMSEKQPPSWNAGLDVPPGGG